MNIQVGLIIVGITLFSFIAGLPLGRYFITEVNERGNVYKLFYISAIIGYALFHLCVFLGTQILKTGTSGVSYSVAGLLLVQGAVFIGLRWRELYKVFRAEILSFILLLFLIIVATLHVLLPVIMGKWEMAYATGDDASRWFMIVDYYQRHAVVFDTKTMETLIFPIMACPLFDISGSILYSILGTTQAIIYSVTSAMALVMGALSLMLVVEGLIDLQNKKDRYILWFITVIFFGAFGSIVNIYYSGRIAHHFSIYPVFASITFFSFNDEGYRRLVWFSFWGIMLALSYTLRYSLNFAILAGTIVIFEWLSKKIALKKMLINVFFLFVSLLLAFGVAWPELKSIVQSYLSSGLSAVTFQRGTNYGAYYNTIIDRFYEWSGFLGTFEAAENFPVAILLGLGAMIVGFIITALYWSIRYFRKHPAYTGLLVYSFLSGTVLLMTDSYFVAWKSSLYWPFYVLVGCIAFSLELIHHTRRYIMMIGNLLIIAVCVFTIATGRQLKMYMNMVDERYTKVDKISYRMIDIINKMPEPSGSFTRKKIFGFDFSTERHLLLREIFKDFDWQPIRGKELSFEHDIVLKEPEEMDDYRYSVLLYANTYGPGEPINFSGNIASQIFASGPFTLYDSASSFPEFRKGILMNIYGYNERKGTRLYGGELVDDTVEVVFVNNGKHKWIDFTLRHFGTEEISKCLSVTTSDPEVNVRSEIKNRLGEYSYHLFSVQNCERDRILKIKFVKKTKEQRFSIVNTRWGY